MKVRDLAALINVLDPDLEVLVKTEHRVEADELLAFHAHEMETWYTHPDRSKPTTVRHDRCILWVGYE